jgi:hypothetical protein
MKEMDYVVTGCGTERTITPRSDRAKKRTAEPVTFNERTEALRFVKAANREGYRISGRELIDPEYRLVRYVYFVRAGGGRFAHAGQDWGPPDPVFEPGDVYPGGPRDGKVAVVLSVVKGEEAKMNGGDVMVLLEERPAESGFLDSSDVGGSTIPMEVYLEAARRFAEHQKREEDRIARYGEIRPQISLEHQGYRFVVVGGTLHYSKTWKFFPDFLRDYVMTVFGREWSEAELAKKEDERHQLMQWRREAFRFMNTQPSSPDGNYSAVPNGFLAGYLTFAYDLYTVADNGRLDELLVHRLSSHDQFQGARHELFAEATCLRAGYTIQKEDDRDRTRRHAEFTAQHRTTGQLISVEAKSKHRSGELGRPGDPPLPGKFSLRFGELLNDALAKKPQHPLVVFIDTNLPPRIADRLYGFEIKAHPAPSRIMNALLDRVRKEHAGMDPYALLVFTNHPHYYASADEVDPRKHLVSVMSQTLGCTANPAAIADIHNAANLYGNIPNFFPAT